jgi:uncharacterized membrane protein
MDAEGPPAAELRPEDPREEARADLSRLLALTDGVFAIIITILVLEIQIPSDLPSRSLADAVREVGPSLTAWVISFLLTGMYWVWHRDTFALIRRANRDLVWLNLLFLLPCSLIPFAASVLGEHGREAIALHTYGAVMIAASLMRIVLYAYVSSRPQLLWVALGKRERRTGLTVAAFPIAIYGLAMLIAEPLPRVSLALFAGMPLLYFFTVTLLRDRSRFRADMQDFS